jgi:hypothetical protein
MVDSLLKVIGGLLLMAAATLSASHPYFAVVVATIIGLLLIIEGTLGVIAWW